MSAEALLDPRFAALPRLVRDATNQSLTRHEIRRFMDELRNADQSLFACALLFLSRDGRGFVLVHESGEALDNSRHWLRWPLRRLFTTRRPCIITSPVTAERALAIPLGTGAERYVVVAPLCTRPLEPAQQTFLDVLQGLSIPQLAPAGASERIPRFVWFGESDDLGKRVAALIARRGWALNAVPTFGHVLLQLERDEADIVLFEDSALKDCTQMLRALRHAAKIGDAPIVLFGTREPTPETAALADYYLPVTVNDADLLNALKTSALLVSGMRRLALRSDVDRLDADLRRARDCHELAHACAEAALVLGADIVSVMLVDAAGGVHGAHLPSQHVLGDHWPAPFITGESLVQTYAEDRFFEDAFDDPQYARTVRQLDPTSAAVMPIGSGTQISGTLLALSTRRPLYEPEFEALSDLCERTARVLATLREPAAGATPWRQVTVEESVIDLYQGARADSALYVVSTQHSAAIVALDGGDRRQAARIAAALLADTQADLKAALLEHKSGLRGILLALLQDGRLRYACEGFAVPLRVPVRGPVPATRIAEECETGTIALDPSSLTLLYSNEFAAQVQTADLVKVVQHELRSSRANVARALPELAPRRGRLAFAAITTLSSASAEQHRPGSV